MTLFLGHFKSREDVLEAFKVRDPNEWRFASQNTSEHPVDGSFDIVVAAYVDENYEGSAFVLIARGGKYFEINGSHCSCHGLEGQWNEEETTVEALKARIAGGGQFLTHLDPAEVAEPVASYMAETVAAERAIREWVASR